MAAGVRVPRSGGGIVGVPGYWRYPEAFISSRWIWTISLVFDNTVLLRKTVR
jgi:hypothetical protein